LRKNHFCDRSVQGALLLHAGAYWLAYLVTATALVLFVELLSGDPRRAWANTLHRHGPSALAMLVLAPIFLRDLCRLSNRFAGPIVRLRWALRELADGNEVPPIQFRDRDFWKELAADFNRAAQRLHAAQVPPSHDPDAAASLDPVEPKAGEVAGLART